MRSHYLHLARLKMEHPKLESNETLICDNGMVWSLARDIDKTLTRFRLMKSCQNGVVLGTLSHTGDCLSKHVIIHLKWFQWKKLKIKTVIKAFVESKEYIRKFGRICLNVKEAKFMQN